MYTTVYLVCTNEVGSIYYTPSLTRLNEFGDDLYCITKPLIFMVPECLFERDRIWIIYNYNTGDVYRICKYTTETSNIMIPINHIGYTIDLPFFSNYGV